MSVFSFRSFKRFYKVFMKKSNPKSYNANFNEDAHIPSQDFESGLEPGLDNFSLSCHFHLLQVT